jgi:hypothetical protein
MRGLLHVTVAACLLFFVLAAGSSIRIPGLYYDEVLFVNAALGNVTGPFVYKSVMGVPVMLMPYIGALKSYVYYPIFFWLGVSPATIRWPVIVISAATLLLAYAVARRVMTAGWAIALLALAASDPAFIGLTKLDYGPVVLGSFLRVLAVLAFLEFVRTGGRLAALAMVAAIVLGLFDKLHFIWFVNALAVAAVVVFHRELGAVARTYSRRFTATVMVLVLTVAMVSWFLILPVLGLPIPGRVTPTFSSRVVTILGASKQIFDGRAPVWMMAGSQTLLSWTWIAVPAALCVAALRAWRRPGANPTAFFLILFGGTLVQLFLTPQARGPHHTISLWPWHHFLIVLALAAIRPGHSAPGWTRALSVVLVAILLVGQVRSTLSIVTAYRGEQGVDIRWDPAIYALSARLEQQYGAAPAIVSTDWGLHTPLHALAAPFRRARYFDAGRVFFEIDRWPPDVRRQRIARLARPGTLVLMYPPGRSAFPATRRNVIGMVAEHDLTFSRLETVTNRAGRPVYEIYRFELGDARRAEESARPGAAPPGERTLQ